MPLPPLPSPLLKKQVSWWFPTAFAMYDGAYLQDTFVLPTHTLIFAMLYTSHDTYNP